MATNERTTAPDASGISPQADAAPGRRQAAPAGSGGAKSAANPGRAARAAQPVAEADAAPTQRPGMRRLIGRLRKGGITSMSRHEILNEAGACLFSIAMHMLILVMLGLWMLPRVEEPTIPLLEVNVTPSEEELTTVELDEQLVADTEATTAAASAGLAEGTEGTAGATLSAPSLNKEVADEVVVDGMQVALANPLSGMPGTGELIGQVPKGTLGEARAIVDSVAEAMDRITQEILLMLSEGPVLVVWCFDESESMKDDQQEIRDRIERVYTELGLTTAAQGDALMTAVTSYGSAYKVHTKTLTNRVDEIRAAIDAVKVDPSGMEITCEAVGYSVRDFHKLAVRGRRQMALILVSDESGDRDNNDRFLEPAIEVAKAANCRIYILGREAVFGYPYAHFHWVHPQTGGHHWLPVDRGPETAFVEQLQTDGLRRRYDAHSSGFGPYEHCRIAQQTGGIFFMLPSEESNIVRGEKRRYELEALRPYMPDLRMRMEVSLDRDNSGLRTTLWKIINDLNPWKPEIAKYIEMRLHFSPDPEAFARQVREEQAKAKQYFLYLDMAGNALKEIQKVRDREYEPRWQANLDLLHAQVLAYKVRLYEYGAYLEYFMQNPKVVPLTKPPNLRLAHWDIRHRQETITGSVTAPYIEEAHRLFSTVIAEHPGTPWASRAEIELKRGFGIELFEVYGGPSKPRVITGPVAPVPKL